MLARNSIRSNRAGYWPVLAMLLHLGCAPPFSPSSSGRSRVVEPRATESGRTTRDMSQRRDASVQVPSARRAPSVVPRELESSGVAGMPEGCPVLVHAQSREYELGLSWDGGVEKAVAIEGTPLHTAPNANRAVVIRQFTALENGWKEAGPADLGWSHAGLPSLGRVDLRAEPGGRELWISKTASPRTESYWGTRTAVPLVLALPEWGYVAVTEGTQSWLDQRSTLYSWDRTQWRPSGPPGIVGKFVSDVVRCRKNEALFAETPAPGGNLDFEGHRIVHVTRRGLESARSALAQPELGCVGERAVAVGFLEAGDVAILSFSGTERHTKVIAKASLKRVLFEDDTLRLWLLGVDGIGRSLTYRYRGGWKRELDQLDTPEPTPPAIELLRLCHLEDTPDTGSFQVQPAKPAHLIVKRLSQDVREVWLIGRGPAALPRLDVVLERGVPAP